MSEIIKEYYNKTQLDSRLVGRKLELFEKYSDIKQEFEYWLETGQYKSNGVVVEGYSAEALAKISVFLDGEGAFMLLIELRENTKKALKQIANGFKMK